MKSADFPESLVIRPPWLHRRGQMCVHVRDGPVTCNHPDDGLVDGLQILGFPPPCHPRDKASGGYLAGLSPAEQASLRWTHTGHESFHLVCTGSRPTRVGRHSRAANRVRYPADLPWAGSSPASRLRLCWGLCALSAMIENAPPPRQEHELHLIFA